MAKKSPYTMPILRSHPHPDFFRVFDPHTHPHTDFFPVLLDSRAHPHPDFPLGCTAKRNKFSKE